MGKHSNKRKSDKPAFRACHPTLRDWILNSLSIDQLAAVMNAPLGETYFGEDHPLASQALGVTLWRAYRDDIYFALEDEWGESDDYMTLRPNSGLDAVIHSTVCLAIGHYVHDRTELMDEAVERQRQEIAEAAAAIPGERPACRPRL